MQYTCTFFQIWIFGMVERETNTIILYPVFDRTSETRTQIILRHVEKGSTIYSDGLSADCALNDLGFKHFTVLHKYSCSKVYVDKETKQEIVVHTNRID